MQKALRIFLLVLIVIGIVLLFTQKIWVPKLVNRILLSETPQQQTPKILIPIPNEPTKTDLIRLNTPLPNQTIQSPLVIKGEARGSWFFEGQFPVELRIPSKPPQTVVATGIAHAQGEWTTENFVPFTATLTFENPTSFDEVLNPEHSLILELKKDNPSGLPQNDDTLEIPVVFAEITSNTTLPPKACTQEAKLCPNGSYVGRTGPNCEFATCF